MLDFENFSWGIILGIFAVVVLLISVFGFLISLNFDPEKVPMFTLLGLNVALVFLEGGIALYILGVEKGVLHKDDKRKSLLLKLNSIKNARKDVQKGFFSRKLDKESRDEMVRDLKKEEIQLQNRIDLLGDKGGEDLEEEIENKEEEPEDEE